MQRGEVSAGIAAIERAARRRDQEVPVLRSVVQFALHRDSGAQVVSHFPPAAPGEPRAGEAETGDRYDEFVQIPIFVFSGKLVDPLESVERDQRCDQQSREEDRRHQVPDPGVVTAQPWSQRLIDSLW